MGAKPPSENDPDCTKLNFSPETEVSRVYKRQGDMNMHACGHGGLHDLICMFFLNLDSNSSSAIM